jgi:hypothetical protein
MDRLLGLSVVGWLTAVTSDDLSGLNFDDFEFHDQAPEARYATRAVSACRL